MQTGHETAAQTSMDKRPLLQSKQLIILHYNTWTPLCCNTIETVPPPITIGPQNQGITHDNGQVFLRCSTDSTGTGEMSLNSTQLICVQAHQSSLNTGYNILSTHFPILDVHNQHNDTISNNKVPIWHVRLYS